jgi:hypothetical protein
MTQPIELIYMSFLGPNNRSIHIHAIKLYVSMLLRYSKYLCQIVSALLFLRAYVHLHYMPLVQISSYVRCLQNLAAFCMSANSGTALASGRKDMMAVFNMSFLLQHKLHFWLGRPCPTN